MAMACLIPRSRKGVELAVNTVVVLILGVIVVGAGVALVWDLVREGSAFAGEVSTAQRSRLAQLYGEGQLVAVTPQSLELRAGDRGQVAVGVRSILSAEEAFTVGVRGTGPDEQPAAGWRIVHFTDLTVRPDLSADVAVAVTPPETAPRGVYTFIVKITRSDGAVYDSPRFFTVRVR